MNKNKYIAIGIVALIITGVSAFYGGTVYENNSLTMQGLLRSGNRTSFGANGNNPSGSQRQGGGIGPGGNNGGFVNGEITAKDDKSITIKGRDGSSKIIYFSDSTEIGKTVDGSASDLNTGEQVLVNGKSNPDGSVSAQNIQIRSVQGSGQGQ